MEQNILEGVQLYKLRIWQRQEEQKYLEAVRDKITAQTSNRTQRNINAAIKENEAQIDKIKGIIEQCPHELKRDILFLKWINGLSLEAIAGRLGYDPAYIAHLHAKAIKEYKIPANK